MVHEICDISFWESLDTCISGHRWTGSQLMQYRYTFLEQP